MHRDHRIDTKAIPESSDKASAEERETHEREIERLFQEHNQSLLRFVTARLHSEQEAREIAQEAYVRLLNLDKPNTVSYLRAFLFRIAANLVSDRLKQRNRRREIRDLVFFDIAKTSPPPEKVLGAREELEVIRLAIEELPAKCRMAFLSHKIHDLSVEDTALQMRLSVRMVRLYIARAIAHCKERLDDTERTAVTM